MTALWWPMGQAECEKDLRTNIQIDQGLTVVLLDAISCAYVPQLDTVVGRCGDQVPDKKRMCVNKKQVGSHQRSRVGGGMGREERRFYGGLRRIISKC